jgi:hypothetical protein
MDALLSLDGILEAKTDIQKAEVYVRAKPGTVIEEDQLRTLIEDDYGYGLRSYETTTDKKWEELGAQQ